MILQEKYNFKEIRPYLIKGIIVLDFLGLFIYNFIQLFRVKGVSMWIIILLGLLFLYCAFGAIIPEGTFYILHWYSNTAMDQYSSVYIKVFKASFWVVLILTSFIPLMMSYGVFC